MNAWVQALLILIATAVVGSLSLAFHPARAPLYEVEDAASRQWKLSTEQARELMAKETVVWIDARSRVEYEKAHFPGAILLNTEEWGDLMYANQMTLQEAYGKPVLVYCGGGGCERSADIAQRLRELIGLDPVYVLDGDWQNLAPQESGPSVSLPKG